MGIIDFLTSYPTLKFEVGHLVMLYSGVVVTLKP